MSDGTRLGKYQLLRRLATGGMAELFLARAAAMHGFEKLVVLKRILPQHAENDDFIKMFLAEARLAATLHHP
ncbi:MAG: serine/threonine protein kinase, partial [Nannocystaceae bacterium]|nr:serine/threonine protein kinase [Nannocystaceae bacterium]